MVSEGGESEDGEGDGEGGRMSVEGDGSDSGGRDSGKQRVMRV